MWVKTEIHEYVDIESGRRMHVATGKLATKYAVKISDHGYGPIAVVHDGYASREDAQAALDELMDETGYVQAQPPVTDEETATAEEVK